MSEAKDILESARDVAAGVDTWADLSNALFAPGDGLVARAFPTREERERFIQTKEYRAIRKLVDDARKRTGVVAGATPTKSGKFSVRLPRSLHAALVAEAEFEGVSLNQLVVAKLAVQLSQLTHASDSELAQAN